MVLAILLFLATAGAASEAERLLAAGRVAEGLAAAESEARSRPDDVVAQERWVDGLLATGRPGEAVAWARRKTEAAPKDPVAWTLLGRATPDAAGSRVAYEAALRLAPDHARAHCGMGAVHLAGGDAAAARDAYLTAVGRDPSLEEAWLGVVRAWRLLGRPDEALAALQQAARAVPDSVSVAVTLADAAPGGAVDALRRTAAKSGWDPRVHGVLARHLLVAGDARGARASAHAALAIDPGQVDALRALAPAEEISSGRLDLAAWERLVALRASMVAEPSTAGPPLDALVTAWPASVLARLARAELRKASGDPSGAESDLRAARAARPDDAEAAAALGVLLLESERPTEAVAPLDAARVLRPWDASLWWMSGVARSRSGDGTGIDLLAEARRRFPMDGRLVSAHIDALLAAGRFDEAYANAKEGLRRWSDPQLAAQFVVAATRSGRSVEAAAFLDQLARASGSASLAALAAKLRAP